jgi:hypothetical protein
MRPPNETASSLFLPASAVFLNPASEQGLVLRHGYVSVLS